MGKKKLLTGIILGATIGGLLSLFDQDAKSYAKNCLKKSRDKASNCMKNPTEAIQNVKRSALKLNDVVEENVRGAVNTLDVIESSLNKVLKK